MGLSQGHEYGLRPTRESSPNEELGLLAWELGSRVGKGIENGPGRSPDLWRGVSRTSKDWFPVSVGVRLGGVTVGGEVGGSQSWDSLACSSPD